MKYRFLIKNNFCFSKLVVIFFFGYNQFLIGRSDVIDIVRDEKGNIFSIEYYNKVSKKLKLLKLETFHSNGHVWKLESFLSGSKNGAHQEFYNNGNIKIDGQYNNGNKSGLWTEYFRNGKTMKLFYAYKNGRNGTISEWYKNGKKKILGAYFQGQKHGLWTAWYSNGVKESLITYKHGKEEGVFSYFYDNGNKKSEGTVSYNGQKEQRCWDIHGDTHNCTENN